MNFTQIGINVQHADQVKDSNFSRLVEDSQHRIISMSLIHGMLYVNSNLSKIHLRDYTKSLFEKLQSSYNKKNIKLKLNVPKEFCFEIDKMIPIGLMMNEVFTNSFKYAFDGKPGEISISIVKNSLIIADNGKGIPAKISKNSNHNFKE